MAASIDQLSHRQYLRSSTWQKIRKEAFNHYGKICKKCGGLGTDVHHLRYPDVQGEEKIKDLMVLCRSCHEAIHGIQRGSLYNEKVHVRALYGYLTEKQKQIISTNLKIPITLIFMSDSLDGQRARNMAVKMLNVRGYYGIKKEKKEDYGNYLSRQELQKIQLKQKRKQVKKQNVWKKLLIASNPRLHGRTINEKENN
jgi:hypothetical protein